MLNIYWVSSSWRTSCGSDVFRCVQVCSGVLRCAQVCNCSVLCLCRERTELLCLLQVRQHTYDPGIYILFFFFSWKILTDFLFSSSQSVAFLPQLRGRGLLSDSQSETRELPVSSGSERREEERWDVAWWPVQVQPKRGGASWKVHGW